MGNPNDQKQGQGGRERDPRDPQQKPMKEGQGGQGQPNRERQREPQQDDKEQPQRR